jgi:hypothetical protein
VTTHLVLQFSEISFAIVWRLSRVQNYVARAAHSCPHCITTRRHVDGARAISTKMLA